MYKKKRGFFSGNKWINFALIGVLAAAALIGCSLGDEASADPSAPVESTNPTVSTEEGTTLSFEDAVTDPSEETSEPETEPAPTAPPDGDPDDVTCQGSYTVTDEQIADAADDVVASLGDEKLTNRELQIYYWMEVAAYRAGESETQPDYDQGLDTQMCALTGDSLTWQQYFLQRALNTWHSNQSLVIRGIETPLELEEAYAPIEKQHNENLSEDLPALQYLYGYYNDYYQPNSMHQAYLDQIPTMLEELAAVNGYADVDAMVLDLAGPGTDADALADYTYLLNWGYMYYTQLNYDMEVTAEEVEAYFVENESAYAAEGLVMDGGYTVNIRQILLIPEGAQVAADGTVTADEESWAACLTEAEDVVAQWNKAVKNLNSRRLENAPDGEFAELANKYSDDAGTADNGGLYSDIRQGQLITELDSWCFDAERQYADVAIIRTAYGYHILCYCGSEELWYQQAESDLLGDLAQAVLTEAMETYPMTVDYSAISLGAALQSGECVTADDVLYPDIAHERFPEAPLYLQRDYTGTMYGKYPVYTYGCGITTMAMLASYMTDNEWTVPELCAIYGAYCFETGTDYYLYDWTPCELGFYGIHRSFSWDDAAAALESGAVVVSLQRGPGYWTKRGHFILLQNFTEDGLVTVRDSNILNYGTIENHKIDAHEVSSITAKNVLYWILEPKVTRCGTCVRCDNTDHADAATGMFLEDYVCEKCTNALTRRNNFLDALESVKE